MESINYWRTVQEQQHVRIRVYPRELEVKKPSPPGYGSRISESDPDPATARDPDPDQAPDLEPPKREAGDITTFSKKSRMRLLRLINQVNTRVLSDAIFITCTYHKDWPLEQQEIKQDLKIFKSKLQEIIPNACWIWRLEPQKRGAPHFHFLVWSWDQDRQLSSKFYGTRIRKAWRGVSGCSCSSCVQRACKVEKIDSYKKAMRYVSKYMAKEDQENSPITGRRWGYSRNLPTDPITEFYLSPEQYENFKNAAIRLLQGGGERLQRQAGYWMEDPRLIFLWLKPKILAQLLRLTAQNVARSHFTRYWIAGSTDPPDEELAELAKKFGHVYD